MAKSLEHDANNRRPEPLIRQEILMTPSELLLEGVELMLFGLGSVFIFLALLIACIRLMAFVIARFDSTPAAQAVSVKPATSGAAAELDADVLAAIQAAIHQHRARRG